MTLAASHGTELLMGKTFAQRPSLTDATQQVIRVTDIGPAGFGSLWVSNGTRWSPLGGRVTLAKQGAVVATIANTETIILQTAVALPAGSLQVNDTIRVWVAPTKSGTTDTCVVNIRIGTAGTTADTAALSAIAILAAGNRTGGMAFDFKLTAATTVQLPANQGVLGSYFQAAATALPAGVTISSAATNALFVTLTLQSSSTNDTVGCVDSLIELLTP